MTTGNVVCQKCGQYHYGNCFTPINPQPFTPVYPQPFVQPTTNFPPDDMTRIADALETIVDLLRQVIVNLEEQ